MKNKQFKNRSHGKLAILALPVISIYAVAACMYTDSFDPCHSAWTVYHDCGEGSTIHSEGEYNGQPLHVARTLSYDLYPSYPNIRTNTKASTCQWTSWYRDCLLIMHTSAQQTTMYESWGTGYCGT